VSSTNKQPGHGPWRRYRDMQRKTAGISALRTACKLAEVATGLQPAYPWHRSSRPSRGIARSPQRTLSRIAPCQFICLPEEAVARALLRKRLSLSRGGLLRFFLFQCSNNLHETSRGVKHGRIFKGQGLVRFPNFKHFEPGKYFYARLNVLLVPLLP